MNQKPTYHIVSHSHWDREWYKSFEQFRSMLVTMVDDLIDLLHHDDSYTCFTLDGQAVILEDYLAVRPEQENALRELISSGRMLSGPWYILPDEFLVSAEATIRNLQTGIRTTGRFGQPMMIGYIPDSFGHIAMMPAILKGFGIDVAMLYRGFGGEPDQTTSEYCWTAPDGSRVLLIHLYSNGYSAGYFHQETDEQILHRFAGIKNELDARATTSQRLLMNGGDHHWPDPRLPSTLELLRGNVEGEFVHSSVPRFVEAVKKEVNGLPEVKGELRFGYRYAFVVLGGVYSSRVYIKQRNWHLQNLLQRYMEPLDAFATLSGTKSNMPLVHQAWKTLLLNHPHDSICGCSIDPVHREMMTRFKAAEDIASSVIDLSMNALIPYDDRAAGDDHYLFFFNPSPFPRSEVAEAQVRFYLQDIIVGLNPNVVVEPKLPPIGGFALVDQDGKEVQFQIIDRREAYDITYTNYNYPKQTYADQFSIIVDARDVPPLGAKGLRIERRDTFAKSRTSLVSCGKNFIENPHLRVEVNPKGEVSIADKASGVKFKHLNIFEDSGDVGDEYNYSYPRRDKTILSNKGGARVRCIEKGPLRVTLEISQTISIPESASEDRQSRSSKTVRVRVRSRLSITPTSRSVSVETAIDNNAKDHRLRVLFTSDIDTDRVLVDSQFCMVERRQKEYDVSAFTIEYPAKVAPMQRFVSVRGKKRGLTLMTYGIPEYELKLDGKGTIALTLLRCVGTLAASALITRPGGKAGWHNDTPDAQCPGTHSFRYALLPDGGDGSGWYELVNGEAERFHLQLLPVRRKNSGPLPLELAQLAVTPATLVMSACKMAEDGSGLIVRVYNPTEKEIRGNVQSHRKIREAHLARLDETILSPLEIQSGNRVGIVAPPGAVVTLHLQYPQHAATFRP